MNKLKNLSQINSNLSRQIDEFLMNEKVGYKLEQLMEMAGYYCSLIINEELKMFNDQKILVQCGPGNNGGDGLVLARFLKFYDYPVSVIYPNLNQEKHPHYVNLVKLLQNSSVDIYNNQDINLSKNFNVHIDSILGFSAHGNLREPYNGMVKHFKNLDENNIIIAIDVPTGWDVDLDQEMKAKSTHESENGEYIPDVLISLTLPKIASKSFEKLGRSHYITGNFVPLSVVNKFNLDLPQQKENQIYEKRI